ncbi:hypothetical protein GCM10023219_30310 [Stakelama sediminis]|uniref:Uncharacterized protein n=1 Tax=Stakelama sediminis TaxID=463200 RepID=A0A840Z2E5_9SPHN|nr:hypothetical protein [Stakelama sediminis]MBB5720063.1 hypothetical protein [Stakelama sediminis]
MRVFRIMAVTFAAFLGFAAAPASAQFFVKPVDLNGPRVTGAEPGILGQAFPGATQAELHAALVWNLRAALNVAALQCNFAPDLLVREQYNAILDTHATELKQAYDTLGHYFERTSKSKRAGQTALDQYGTRLYSGLSTVGGQLSFCETAAKVGSKALFAPPGGLTNIAEQYMYEIRRSLLNWGDQVFANFYVYFPAPQLPDFTNDRCWDQGEYQDRKCGPYPYRNVSPPAAIRG